MSFEQVDAGAYTVYLETPGARGVHQVFAAVYLEAVRTEQERQTVQVGRHQLPTARIALSALAPDGRPARGARLILLRRFGRHYQEGLREADDRGRIDTGLVPPGKYDLTLQCRDHAALELGERVLQPRERLDLGGVRFR